jgi:hypothetical protein
LLLVCQKFEGLERAFDCLHQVKIVFVELECESLLLR